MLVYQRVESASESGSTNGQTMVTAAVDSLIVACLVGGAADTSAVRKRMFEEVQVP
jgi:hypothetical protein